MAEQTLTRRQGRSPGVEHGASEPLGIRGRTTPHQPCDDEFTARDVSRRVGKIGRERPSHSTFEGFGIGGEHPNTEVRYLEQVLDLHISP